MIVAVGAVSGDVTVRIAASLLVTPNAFETTTRKLAPLSAGLTEGIV
jgi:hypothetical protein